jgi:hypothetical protein
VAEETADRESQGWSMRGIPTIEEEMKTSFRSHCDTDTNTAPDRSVGAYRTRTTVQDIRVSHSDNMAYAPPAREAGAGEHRIRVSRFILLKTLGITVDSSYCWQGALQQSLLPLRMNVATSHISWN